MSNIEVKVVADVTALTTQFGIARAESQSLTREFNLLARQATEMGPQTADFQQKLNAAAEAMVTAKAKAADLNAQLKEAQGGAQGFSAALSDANSLLGQFGVALGIAGLFNFAKDSLDFAANIEHMSAVLGISTTDFQAFQFAARESGVATEDADTMLRRFMSNLGGLHDNAGPAVKAIEDLGLTADELSGPPTIALQKVAEALLRIPDPAERARIETELFGRSGLDLNAMVSKLAQGFGVMTAAAIAAGQVIDPKITDAAEKAEEKTAGFWAQVKGLAAEIAVGGWESFKVTLEGYGELFDELTGKAQKFRAALPSTAGGLPLNLAKPQMPDAGAAPEIHIVSPEKAAEEARKAAEIARRLSDEIAQDAEQLSLKQISAAETANNFELAMGQESLDQWKAKAIEGADAKLAAELKYLNAKAAADKGNVVAERKDLDDIKAAHQEHTNALQQIDQKYAQDKRAIDQKELADKIQADNSAFSDTVSKLSAEVSDHQISAQQRRDAEIALATTVEREELAMFDATHVNLVKGTAAWADAIKQRQAIVDAFNKRAETANDQLTKEEAQKWTQLGHSIESSFNSALDGVLFQGNTLGQFMLNIAEGIAKAFLQMGETILENWIETQIAQELMTKTTQGATALGQVSDQAAIAGATAYAQYAAFPPVATAMAAEAVGATMAFSSLIALESGTSYVPKTMPYLLHEGEKVTPARYNHQQGGDVHMHYGPTVNAREPASLKQMLVTESSEMVAWLQRQMRNGSLRMA